MTKQLANSTANSRPEGANANTFRETWDRYTSSWKASDPEAKRALFEGCLAEACEYTDPLMATRGWDELLAYMLDFHRQLPGGHFVTNHFSAHHGQSIAKWHMCDADGNVVGDGVSYGKYDSGGRLVAMTGFFETPGAN